MKTLYFVYSDDTTQSIQRKHFDNMEQVDEFIDDKCDNIIVVSIK